MSVPKRRIDDVIDEMAEGLDEAIVVARSLDAYLSREESLAASAGARVIEYSVAADLAAESASLALGSISSMITSINAITSYMDEVRRSMQPMMDVIAASVSAVASAAAAAVQLIEFGRTSLIHGVVDTWRELRLLVRDGAERLDPSRRARLLDDVNVRRHPYAVSTRVVSARGQMSILARRSRDVILNAAPNGPNARPAALLAAGLAA